MVSNVGSDSRQASAVEFLDGFLPNLGCRFQTIEREASLSSKARRTVELLLALRAGCCVAIQAHPVSPQGNREENPEKQSAEA
jgi:hypothetical protein